MKYFSLFSGVGGFEIGIKNAYENTKDTIWKTPTRLLLQSKRNCTNNSTRNSRKRTPFIECIGFSEIDKYANQVLKYQFPKIKNYGDITKINWQEVPDFDLLVGGSPCQDFSIAGKREGILGERSGLVWEFIRCLEEKKPQYFIWENVKGVMSSRRGFDFANIITAFSEAGYSLWWQVLNAKDFGVPQNRERIFIVGFREENPREVFFEPAGNEKNNGKFTKALNSSDWRGANRNQGQNLVEITKEASQGYRVYDPQGIATNQASQAGGLGAKTGLYMVGGLQKHQTLRNDGASPSLTSAMGMGGGQTPIVIPVLTPDRLKKRQNGRRFKTNGEPSFTLNTQDKHGIFNGSRIRRLTPIECERLMSWPDNWTKYGINEKGEKVEISDTQRYKQCGNGVISKVITFLMEYIIVL